MNEKNLGGILKNFRMSQGLTLEELSKRSKISKGMISKLENSKQSNPTIKTLKALSKSLGLDLKIQIGWMKL